MMAGRGRGRSAQAALHNGRDFRLASKRPRIRIPSRMRIFAFRREAQPERIVERRAEIECRAWKELNALLLSQTQQLLGIAFRIE